MILSEKLEKKAFEIADYYNPNEQIDVLIEEMSELTKALLKNRRARKALLENRRSGKGQALELIKVTQENIVEEIADVEIMIQQLTHYLGDSKQEVIKVMEEKLDRQLKRIAKEQ